MLAGEGKSDWESLPNSIEGSKFDLCLGARTEEQGPELKLVYNADLFSTARITELLAQYQRLLEQVVKNPAQRLEDFSLVTPAATTILPNASQPLRTHQERSLLHPFGRQVQRVPEQTAVMDRATRWTYRELNARSNQLAHWLCAHGVRKGDVVAIYAHRSAALVWALLGVWKAGAAFLILDPRYPATRLAERIHLAKPRAWLQLVEADTLPETLEEAALSCHCHLVLPSANQADACQPLTRQSTQTPQVGLGPDDLAYVVFTSGTTGAAKGILGTHRPLSHFCQWHGDTFGLKETDRFSLLSGLSHDSLLRDIFTPLTLGATLCIPEAKDWTVPGGLTTWLAHERISVVHLTPALGQWLSEGNSNRIESLRCAFFGGDQLTRRDVTRFRELAPAATCVNFYGTTETPQAMSYFVVPPASAAARTCVPIGRGIGDVQLLVLNAAGQLAGVGELGEIHVRTPYLTLGYLDDATLTASRFVTNPATQDSQDRLYKTGDLGRFLPDGQVELAGRADQQVKLRGFRIELGEIEAALAKHPALSQVIVVRREDTPGDARLVAYGVPREQGTISTNDWREFLTPQLPDYMIPSAFMTVARLPLTPNGKIDRRALPNPGWRSQPSPESSAELPSLLEARLITLWENVLGRSGISVKDNFFDLGGHSLLAVRLFAQIEKALGTRLPLATLFEAQTIERLAEAMRQQGWRCASLIPIQPNGPRPPLFCVHEISGEVLCYRALANHLGPDQPLYGLQARGLDGSESPLVRIADMATRYLEEIRELQPHGPYYLAGASFGGLVTYEMASRLHEQGEEVRLAALFDTNSRGYYESLPTLTACQYQLDTLRRRILYNLRQAVFGGTAFWREKVHSLRRRVRRSLWRLACRFTVNRGGALPRGLWNVRQANALAAQNYAPRPYPGRLTLFRARQQYIERLPEPTLGWGRLALGGVDILDAPGAHATVLQEPHVSVVAAFLRKCLDEAVAAKPSAVAPTSDKGPSPVKAAA
jgi:amino acid adenylation domain-containing protein